MDGLVLTSRSFDGDATQEKLSFGLRELLLVQERGATEGNKATGTSADWRRCTRVVLTSEAAPRSRAGVTLVDGVRPAHLGSDAQLEHGLAPDTLLEPLDGGQSQPQSQSQSQ